MEQKPIHLRNAPWPAEIFDHPDFIASIAKWYRPNLFIEYGVSSGRATEKYAPYCKKIIGVDIKMDMTPPPNMDFYEMSTRDFKTILNNMKEPVEMAFIDADHKAEVSFQDFEDLFPHLIENGIIFIHDTFPCSSEWADPGFCSDSWRVPNMIKEKYGKICDVFTIPIQPGLTMVRKYTKPLEHLSEKK